LNKRFGGQAIWRINARAAGFSDSGRVHYTGLFGSVNSQGQSCQQIAKFDVYSAEITKTRQRQQ